VTTTPSRTLRRDATENRAALLTAAQRVLNQQPDASLELIAAEAGLSRRAVYGHFASRDDLLRELITTGSRRVALALEAITHDDPVVRLALIASGLWREVENIRVMTVFAVRGPLKRHTDEGLLPLRLELANAITAGREAGMLRTDISAERLARLLEDAALAVLEESMRHPVGAEEGHRLVMLNVLGTIGFGWREAGAFIDAHAELRYADHPRPTPDADARKAAS
jgi:AcrR family transcriptional regulator